MKRIDWTDTEDKVVMAEYHRLKTTAGITNGEAYRQAQQHLPEHRRRPNPGDSVIWTFNKRYQHKLDSGHVPERPEGFCQSADSAHVPASLPPLSEIRAANGSNPPPTMPEIVVVEKKVIVRELPDYGRIPTVTLARILLERLAAMEENEAKMLQLSKLLESERRAEAAYDRRLDPRPEAEQPKPDALRICVVGLLPNQQHEVDNRIQNIARPLKVRYFDSHSGPQDFPSIVDFIIVCAHTTHVWWNKAKAALPADCVFFVDTGVGAVVQKIYDLASRQTITTQNHQSVPPSLRPS